MQYTYNEEMLQNLIKEKCEEDLHLEYKSASKLDNKDAKEEISKNISAFANADGGILVLGIQEFNEENKKHLPEKITPIDRSIYTKEWLEQVINSNIHPRIQGTEIHIISITPHDNKVVYWIEIPKSDTVHQAKDQKYYRRYNFQVLSMLDHEIRDVMNRSSHPILNLILSDELTTFNGNILKFPLLIANSSRILAEKVQLVITFDNYSEYIIHTADYTDSSDVNPGKKTFTPNANQLSVYNGLRQTIGFFTITLNDDTSRVNFTTQIFANGVYPIINIIEIIIENGKPKYYTNS